MVLYFAPLYGGAALLIREVTVRTGRGWPGRLLLGTAFGVAMATVIDLSLFTPTRHDIDGWETIVNAAAWGGLGWHAVVAWVGGHAVMSVAAPIVIGESLARRPGPWLGPVGLGVVGLGFLVLAATVHRDQSASYPNTAGSAEFAVSSAIVLVLCALALTPLGRPVGRGPFRRVPSWPLCVAIGFAGIVGFDLGPLSWIGVATAIAVLVMVAALVVHRSRSPAWTTRHVAALTFGAVLGHSDGLPGPAPSGHHLAGEDRPEHHLLACRTRPGMGA